eukprot:4001757-Pyramimonas_sp.AAC.1
MLSARASTRLLRCTARAQNSNMAFPTRCAVALTSSIPSALRYAPKLMAPDGGDGEKGCGGAKRWMLLRR